MKYQHYRHPMKSSSFRAVVMIGICLLVLFSAFNLQALDAKYVSSYREQQEQQQDVTFLPRNIVSSTTKNASLSSSSSSSAPPKSKPRLGMISSFNNKTENTASTTTTTTTTITTIPSNQTNNSNNQSEWLSLTTHNNNSQDDNTSQHGNASISLLASSSSSQNNTSAYSSSSSSSSSSSILHLDDSFLSAKFQRLHQQDVNHNFNTSQNSFSACIYVKDENHRLPEWIAYHYWSLPLRNLVILDDPNAQTSPNSILERWSKLINITLWNDQDIGFKPRVRGKQQQQQAIGGGDLVRRQKLYYSKCAMYLKHQRNATWTAFFDVDEYIKIEEERFPIIAKITTTNTVPSDTIQNNNNNNNNNKNNNNNNNNNTTTITTTTLRSERPGHILELLQDPLQHARHLIRNESTICTPVERVTFGAREELSSLPFQDDDNDKVKVPSFLKNNNNNNNNNATMMTTTATANFISLETLRFRWRAKKQSSKINGAQKSLFNVQYAPNTNDASVYGVHSVIRPDCFEQRWKKKLLSIHHYKGSLESYFARKDSRRTIEMFQQTQEGANEEEDDTICPWIGRFVDYVGGPAMAEYLLQGSGQIITSTTTTTANTTTH